MTDPAPAPIDLAETCRNAEVVHNICQKLGIEFRGYPVLRELLLEAIEELGDQGPVIPVHQLDGAFILPPED